MRCVEQAIRNRTATAMIAADLNILRCFAGSGIKTCITSSDPKSILFHSRYCRGKRIVANSSVNPERFITDLVELGKGYAEHPILYYNSDGTLLALSRNREKLLPYYRFLLPPVELVEDLVDKTRFARFATELHLPVPRTLRPSQVQHAEDVLAQMTLPCILKPNSRHLGWHDLLLLSGEGNDPQKGLIAHTPEEFSRMYTNLRQATDQFIIQPYIPGGDDCIYSFHGYFDHHAKPLAYFVGRKIRTYPKNNGVSTYLELTKEPEVVRLSLEVLCKMNFVGAVKIDLKKDRTTGQLYMLEINPRYTLWNQLGAACGINLALVAYAEQTGQPIVPQTEYRTDVRWLSFGNDLRAFVRSYRPAGDLSFEQWVCSLASSKVYDVFAWDDPMPFLVSFWNYVKLVIGKRLGSYLWGPLGRPVSAVHDAKSPGKGKGK